MYKDRLDHLNTEKQARLEILSQSRKDLQTQVARIRQSLEKVLDKKERIFGRKNSYLISSTGHNHIFNIDCPFDDYLNNCSCHYKCLWGRGRRRRRRTTFSTKRLNRIADALKRLAGKAVEALTAIVESVFGAI